jgi:hypothetical protein
VGREIVVKRLNANCEAPATEASVWYALTPASSQPILIDVSRSDYSAGIAMVTGAPGARLVLEDVPS